MSGKSSTLDELGSYSFSLARICICIYWRLDTTHGSQSALDSLFACWHVCYFCIERIDTSLFVLPRE
jgi:hypothetical protein